MGSDSGDRPNTIHWPPILYLIVIVATWVLGRWMPLPAVSNSAGIALMGWALFTIGGVVGGMALLNFRRIGTPFDPTAAAEKLAEGGIYRFTRNPMYLGALVGFLGLGLALRQTWLLLLLVPLALALQWLAIFREEAYLERRFGDRYRNYKRRVRRWL